MARPWRPSPYKIFYVLQNIGKVRRLAVRKWAWDDWDGTEPPAESMKDALIKLIEHYEKKTKPLIGERNKTVKRIIDKIRYDTDKATKIGTAIRQRTVLYEGNIPLDIRITDTLYKTPDGNCFHHAKFLILTSNVINSLTPEQALHWLQLNSLDTDDPELNALIEDA